MAEPKVKLKFRRIYHGYFNGGEACMLPNGYRLATVEEISKNIDVFKKWELPVKTNGNFSHKNTRLLDGWMVPDTSTIGNVNFVLGTGAANVCRWNAVVKRKEWDNDAKKWQNSSALYSSNGNLLREHLYDGVNVLEKGIEIAWYYAYTNEDVELLYWLWCNHEHKIQAQDFKSMFHWHKLRRMGDAVEETVTPVREMVIRLRSQKPRVKLQMENPMEETALVLNYAMRKGTCDWGVAMVELFIEVYGTAFVETAAAMTFKNIESLPIFTKLLSLSLHQLEDQIPNIKPRFREVLIEAVERGYSELVDKMLHLEDEIAQIATDDCVQALRVAVGRGYIELVRSLLSNLLKSWNGVELPVEVDNEGKTLFHYALPHSKVFELLEQIYAGSDEIITRQDVFGRNILHWAAKGACDSEFVNHILESLSSAKSLLLCHQRDNQERIPLHIAASKGDSGMIEKLLHNFQDEKKQAIAHCCIRATDSSGQTALQMAAGEGHEDSVILLLHSGSDPLRERDGRRRTALHYTAQVKDPKLALATCRALVESSNINDCNKSLLLWASATGIGTADEMEDVHSHVKTYLKSQKMKDKEHLLRAAAVTNNPEMAWEILNRGSNMADILDPDWSQKLDDSKKKAVKNVISHMERMKEQGRDQPSMEDKLGRHAFAEGLAALLLNRFIESPITVGISGEWGMGKSSLMIQTEKILIMTAAQLTFPNLLPLEQFAGAQKISLNARGRKIYQQIKREVHNLLTKDRPQDENPLVTMLTEYQPRYHAIYKSLACMDNNQMLQSNSISQQEHALRGVPRILTIQYNAWRYRDGHEAWAGLGVTVTKEIENAMTRAQWMSTCWRYTWAKHRLDIWIQVFLPCLLGIFLAGWVAWIVWVLLKQAKFQGLKYGSIPFTIIVTVWVILKSVISVVKPVSTQMLGYITSPDHTSHLGYQENVIADINFLIKELGKKPHWFFSFILGLWCWNWFGLFADNIENTTIPKYMPASGDEIRIVIFVDDLDRCEEKVILQVLSAVNLVLAECKINVILGIDKKMVERAIRKNFDDAEDEDLAEKFICKIIQIPLSLPDPTEQETNNFLEYHLGHKYRKTETVLQSPRSIVLSVEPSRDIDEEKNSTGQEEDIASSQDEDIATTQDDTVLNIEPCNELEPGCREEENISIGQVENAATIQEEEPRSQEENVSTSQEEEITSQEENVNTSQEEEPANQEKRGCRGVTKSAVDWLVCHLGFAFTANCNISTELREPYDESFNSLRSAEGVKFIRELLLPNYTEEEAFIFYELSKFASGNQKLPREWKRLLNYHKFAWYVLFRIGKIYSLPTWKEELIGWIFVCWQWKHEMNHLIKGWHKYSTKFIYKQNKDRKQRRSRGPLLSEIVAECMLQLKFSPSWVPEGSNTTERQEGFMKLRRSSRQDPSMKEMLSLYRDNERINEEGTTQNSWAELQKALKIRDVSMEAIQLFQQFRLHCETNHLQWPFETRLRHM